MAKSRLRAKGIDNALIELATSFIADIGEEGQKVREEYNALYSEFKKQTDAEKGHIHGPQNIGSERIRYCGTPLKYSFSEAGHKKSVTVVELKEKGSFLLHTVPLTPMQDLREIRGTYEEVTAKSFYENTAVEDYLHITLTDEEDVPEAVARLRVIYPNLMKLSYDNKRTRSNSIIDGALDVQKKSPLQLFGELYEQQNNQPMSDIQQAFMKDLIEHIWEAAK